MREQENATSRAADVWLGLLEDGATLDLVENREGYELGGREGFLGREAASIRPANPTGGPPPRMRSFGEDECQGASLDERAAAQLGGRSSSRRLFGQPAAIFLNTSVRYASGSMPASVQVPITV